VRERFDGSDLSSRFVVTYYGLPEGRGLEPVSGVMLARHSTCWFIDATPTCDEPESRGVRLAADMFFFPRPGFVWEQTSHPYPLGFQNDHQGGVGDVYARFAFVDRDGDGHTDAVQFESRDNNARQIAVIDGYSPAIDMRFHRFAIDLIGDRATAYFDGRKIAEHPFKPDQPVWVVGRNEYINVLMDDIALTCLDNTSAAPGAPQPVDLSMFGEVSEAHRCCYLRGLGSEAYGIEQTFTAGQMLVAGTWSIGAAPPLWPTSAKQLADCNSLILGNVPIPSIGPGGIEIIETFLEQGRSLIVLGGIDAYDAPAWKRSGLDRWLPIELPDARLTLQPIGEAPLRIGKSHQVTAGLDPATCPPVRWLHTIDRTRPGAITVLTAGDRPLLVLWEKDGARVACLLGTPYGDVGDNYIGWEQWPTLITQLLRWAERSGGPEP